MNCIFIHQCSADKFACFVSSTEIDSDSVTEPAQAYIHLARQDNSGTYSILSFNEELYREDIEKIIEIAKTLERDFDRNYERTRKLLETANSKKNKNTP